MNKKLKLIIENQKLTSWASFYNDSPTDLLVRRYHRVPRKIVINRETGETKTIPVIPFPEFSSRLLEDKKAAKKCQERINKNQKELNELYDQKKKNINS